MRFAVLALAVTSLLILVGLPLTRSLAGDAAIPAMLVACAVSLAGSLISAVTILLSRELGGAQGVFTAMGAMGIRLAVVVLAGLLIALSGWVALKPFLLWLALSHMVLLIVDTRLILGRGASGATSN